MKDYEDYIRQALVNSTLALDRIARHETECRQRWGLVVKLMAVGLMQLWGLFIFLLGEKLGWVW